MSGHVEGLSTRSSTTINNSLTRLRINNRNYQTWNGECGMQFTRENPLHIRISYVLREIKAHLKMFLFN
jgi:hypothetical protein